FVRLDRNPEFYSRVAKWLKPCPVLLSRRPRVKNADSLLTLSHVLTRTLLVFVGVFSLANSALLAAYLFWLSPAQFSPLSLLGIWLLSLVVLLPLMLLTQRYLIRLIANPITHLIATTQLSSAHLGKTQPSTLRGPVTTITEINIL